MVSDHGLRLLEGHSVVRLLEGSVLKHPPTAAHSNSITAIIFLLKFNNTELENLMTHSDP